MSGEAEMGLLSSLESSCCLGKGSPSLGTQESWDAGQVLEEQAISLGVQTLWDHLVLGTFRQQLEQFVRLDHLGLASLKLSKI